MMSNNFHIVVSQREFDAMIPSTNFVVVELENKYNNKKLIMCRNESKDPVIPDKGIVVKVCDLDDSSFELGDFVVFEKYVGSKINVIGNDKKYLIINKKHIKMKIKE